MSFRLIVAVLATVVGVSLWGPGFVSPAAAQTIRSIQVENNHRIEAETVRSYMQIAPGDTYSAEKVDASLKVLFRTGL
ncbi:MAG TPA: POTRA domain-containing protein, partial [Sphingomonadaceae bacterium]|nr:POTRA domain-containing protein [Sphingomonadaceae bacterium]